MSWQDILKEDNELDKEVKVVLEGVQDFKYSIAYRDPQHFIEDTYNHYKEFGLETLIEELERIQDKQQSKSLIAHDDYDTWENLFDMKDIIEELKRLI